MKKKIKDSAKAEMKDMIQKELARIMAKQISKEDFFKEMMQEVVDDFYEEEQEETTSPQLKEGQEGTNLLLGGNPFIKRFKEIDKNRLGHISDIMAGKYKDEYSIFLNKEVGDVPGFNSIPVTRPLSKTSNVELTKEQMNKIFESPKVSKLIDELSIFNNANPKNMQFLKNIVSEQAIGDYSNIQYTKEILKEMFNYIEKNKSKLKATHEQLHINNKSVETYKINNGEERDLVDDSKRSFSGTKINPNFFGYELEIKTSNVTNQKTLALKNLTVNENSVSEGMISAEEIGRLLNLTIDIYSETQITPLSKEFPEEFSKKTSEEEKKETLSKRALKAWETRKKNEKTKSKTKVKSKK
jgi:hypothetical protein